MSDTSEPTTAPEARTQLAGRDIAGRAAAARALARLGGWEDLEPLVDIAKTDNSPSVRLYTAAAAADIAARLRDELDPDRVERIHQWVKSFDPGSNPSLLMLLSAVGDQQAVDRLVRMMRDPRNGVRAGACTALRRMALSASAAGDGHIAVAVRKALGTRRMALDVLADLARLVGEAGYAELDGDLDTALAAGGPAAAAVQPARERLVARTRPDTWSGLWTSDGADVLEAVDGGEVVSWMVVDSTRVWQDGGPPGDVVLDGVGARLAGHPARLVWVPRVGESGQFLAIQVDGRTYHREEGKGLTKRAEDLVEALASVPGAALVVAEGLASVEGAGAARARALVLAEAGHGAAAIEVLEPMLSAKKPRADLHWIAARAHQAAGDLAAARAEASAYLERAGKRASFREQAEALLA